MQYFTHLLAPGLSGYGILNTFFYCFSRLVAWFVDTVFHTVLSGVVFFILGIFLPDYERVYGVILLLLVSLVIRFVYFACFEALTGTTPGKKCMNLRVEFKPNSNRWVFACIRQLTAGFVFISYGVTLLPVLFTKDFRCVHDMLSFTKVVKTK